MSVDLRRAVDHNLHSLFRAMARLLPGAELEEGEHASWHHATPTNPMFKGVWGLSGSAAEVEAAIDDGLAWLAGRRAPFAFVWAGTGAAPAGVHEALLGRGLEVWEADAPALGAELEELDWTALDRVPAGLAIERVRDEAGLGDFARMFRDAFGAPAWATDAWVDATLAVGIDEAPWPILVAYLDGEPVATTIVWNGGGVASVFGVGTTPPARGRGIGAAITLAGFAVGRDEGLRHGVLFSTELGLPVYRRIGFGDLGAGVTRYLWRAP